MDSQLAQEQARNKHKYNDPVFKMKNETFHGSYMMDTEKGRDMEVPKEFPSYRKDISQNKWSRTPTSVS